MPSYVDYGLLLAVNGYDMVIEHQNLFFCLGVLRSHIDIFFLIRLLYLLKKGALLTFLTNKIRSQKTSYFLLKKK
jgi:hypothetical protein